VDRDSDVPLYRQITKHLADQIHAGKLAPGLKLPSTRELAATLEVSRIIVADAYAELESLALVFGRRGSGTYVAAPLAAHPRGDDFIPAQDWPLRQQAVLSRSWQPGYQELLRLLKSVPHPQPISFAEARTRTIFGRWSGFAKHCRRSWIATALWQSGRATMRLATCRFERLSLGS